MCKVLKVSRASYYKTLNKTVEEVGIDPYAELIKKIFIENRRSYGTRRLKKSCEILGVTLSRRRIARIMRYLVINSVYTVKRFKPLKSNINESKVSDIVDRAFDVRKQCEVLVSDLTYVRVGDEWNFICTIIDLYNRQIIGYSCGPHKTALLVLEAFATIPVRHKK